MTATYKPHGYTSLAPYLSVRDASQTLAFLTKVFDGVELSRIPTLDGRIMHAEIRIDDTVLMLADGSEGWPALPSHVHIYVPDVDATYKRAIEAGATSVQVPVQKGDADKRGGVKDIGGTTWWMATQVG